MNRRHDACQVNCFYRFLYQIDHHEADSSWCHFWEYDPENKPPLRAAEYTLSIDWKKLLWNRSVYQFQFATLNSLFFYSNQKNKSQLRMYFVSPISPFWRSFLFWGWSSFQMQISDILSTWWSCSMMTIYWMNQLTWCDMFAYSCSLSSALHSLFFLLELTILWWHKFTINSTGKLPCANRLTNSFKLFWDNYCKAKKKATH